MESVALSGSDFNSMMIVWNYIYQNIDDPFLGYTDNSMSKVQSVSTSFLLRSFMLSIVPQ